MTTTPLYCSNIQLHKFFRVEAAEKILLAIKAADKRDKLGYQVCVCFFFFIAGQQCVLRAVQPNTCFDSYLNRNPLHLMWGLDMGGSQLVHRIVRGSCAYQNVSNCVWDRARNRKIGLGYVTGGLHFFIDIIVQ